MTMIIIIIVYGSVSIPAISSWEGCWCVPGAKESQYLLLSGTRTVYTNQRVHSRPNQKVQEMVYETGLGNPDYVMGRTYGSRVLRKELSSKHPRQHRYLLAVWVNYAKNHFWWLNGFVWK